MPESKAALSKKQAGQSRRKQLHILYLLNDLLHHTKYHLDSSSAYSILTGTLQPHLVQLFGAAGAYNAAVYFKQHKRLNDLLRIWENNGYYQSSYIQKLRDAVSNAASTGSAGQEDDSLHVNGKNQDGSQKEVHNRKAAPYIMPATHGDPSAPYYDLPAGNMMPHIIPNSTAPINPLFMRPLQFVAGPADDSLVHTVKDFLKEVDALYGGGVDPLETSIADIDELGQQIVHDELSGEVIGGEAYYGWSRAFCEKMKRREGNGRAPRLSYSDDQDLRRNISPRKRRRYSSSDEERNGDGRRSRSSSRSSRARFAGTGASRKRSFSRSRSSSRDESRPGFQRYGSLRSRSRSRSRSRPYSPPPIITSNQENLSQQPPPEFLNAFPQGIPLGPGGVPIPPPRPSNYVGPWPPPPPPLPPHAPAYSSFIPPPPPSSFPGPRPSGLTPVPLAHQGHTSSVAGKPNFGNYQAGPPASRNNGYGHGGPRS